MGFPLGAAIRRWVGMRQVAKLAAAGTGDALLSYANRCGETEIGLLARGAYGRHLFYISRPREAVAVFSDLRGLVRHREDRRSGYVNVFCLCYLSLLRGTAGYNDAVMFAKRARNFRPSRGLRRLLAMPDLPERVFPGGVATWVTDGKREPARDVRVEIAHDPAAAARAGVVKPTPGSRARAIPPTI
jgi:hypothetical protein